MASIVLNKSVIVKTLETFGTVDNVEILEMGNGNSFGDGLAKIKFKTTSTYTMVVPVTWLFVKTGDGSTGAIAKGKIVSANIQLDEVLSRKGVITEIGENFIVGEFGERTRMIPFSRIKDISATTESLGAKPAALPAPAKVAKPAAPKAAPVAAPAAPKAPVRKK